MGGSGRWRALAQAAQAFARDEEGATAVEFAMVAFPFFLMLFAVLEVTYLFFISTTLENATMEAARRIRTGELQLSGADGAAFRQSVCDQISVLVPCDDRIQVDVRTYTDFDAYDDVDPVDDGEFDGEGLGVDFGEAGDIVVASVFFVWDVFTPDLGTGMSNLNDGQRLIVATAAFRNEPFGDVTGVAPVEDGDND